MGMDYDEYGIYRNRTSPGVWITTNADVLTTEPGARLRVLTPETKVFVNGDQKFLGKDDYIHFTGVSCAEYKRGNIRSTLDTRWMRRMLRMQQKRWEKRRVTINNLLYYAGLFWGVVLFSIGSVYLLSFLLELVLS